MPAQKISLPNDNEVYNFYWHKDIQKLITKYDNPNYQSHGISVPFRMGVIAGSGYEKPRFF